MNELNMAIAIALVLLAAGSIWVFVADPKQIVRDPRPSPSPTVDGWADPQKVMGSEKKQQLKAMVDGLH